MIIVYKPKEAVALFGNDLIFPANSSLLTLMMVRVPINQHEEILLNSRQLGSLSFFGGFLAETMHNYGVLC